MSVAAAALPVPPEGWCARIAARLRGTAPQHERAAWLLPGLTTAESRHYDRYLPPAPFAAAVLVPILARATPGVLFERRAVALRHHAGQVSFPGGRLEDAQEAPLAAALREAGEEIGLTPAQVTLAGYLPDHILLSGFRVTPVVGFVEPGFVPVPDAREVQDTFEVSLDYLFDPANHRPRRRRFVPQEEEVELCEIPFGEHNIWGATAGMVIALYRLCVAGSTAGSPA